MEELETGESKKTWLEEFMANDDWCFANKDCYKIQIPCDECEIRHAIYEFSKTLIEECEKFKVPTDLLKRLITELTGVELGGNKSVFDKVRKSVEKTLQCEFVIPPKEQIIAELKKEKEITDSIPTEWSTKNENIYR